jgi:hypothetical protein
MKRYFLILVAICLLAFVGLSIWVSALPSEKNLYAKSAQIISLDYDNDFVTIEDANGFCWTFDSCEDWMVGDYCACVMNDRGTLTIFDDEIISVTYQGFEKTF